MAAFQTPAFGESASLDSEAKKTTVFTPRGTPVDAVKLRDAMDKALAGITDNLIRVSVGVEALEDLKNDMRRGLQALET